MLALNPKYEYNDSRWARLVQAKPLTLNYVTAVSHMAPYPLGHSVKVIM